MQSIEAAALYMLAQVVQLHQLWPCTPSTNEEETKQAWNGHVCAWVAMASWDMLAIIKLFVAPLLSTQELVADAAIVGLQCCLIAALFVIFAWPVSRRIRLPDAEVAIPPAGVTRRVRSPLLQSSVADEIQMAGGLWQWFKSETGLTLYRPHIQGAFFNSLAESRNGEPLRKVWKLLLELTIVTLLTSRTGLSSVRKLLWQKFKLRREQLARTRIFEHLMNHEASFHDTADTADVNGATAAGAGVCDAFDFLVLRAVPELITLVGTAVAHRAISLHSVDLLLPRSSYRKASKLVVLSVSW
ncbi:hypothetical protein SBRCBS47491_009924 [Sporothrix bragantina]|uniref:ABC transmembrane type-1 domain-containing protein n=1 Tax=Sporothrix bragantina TaxID=671064 RepID=A0ABP0D0H3_9PEZI